MNREKNGNDDGWTMKIKYTVNFMDTLVQWSYKHSIFSEKKTQEHSAQFGPYLFFIIGSTHDGQSLYKMFAGFAP